MAQEVQVPPNPGFGDPQEQYSPISPDTEGHKKKSVMGKVRDKAKKLKTKMKPKSPGAGDNNESSSSESSNEEERSSDPQQQAGDERGVAVAPGSKGDAYGAVPDPHSDTAGVGEKFGHLKLDDKQEDAPLKDKVPSAPGQEVGRGKPVEEGKTAGGEDLLVKPPTSEKDSTNIGAGTAAGIGAAALGLKAGDEACKEDSSPSGTAADIKPSITSRAAGTVAGLKDTIAAKLGYGSSKDLTPEGNTPTSTPGDSKPGESKGVLQTVQETAAGATAAVSSKLGYGDKPSLPGAEATAGGESKPYTQQIKEAAFAAKDAVGAQIQSVKESDPAAATTGDKTYLQKARDVAIGAKDTVVAKSGYGATDEQSTPAGTGTRFHPGEEDKALSALITEKMSTGAATVKDTLLRPFSAAASKGPPTPTTTPPPSSATAVEKDPANTLVDAAKPGEE